MIDEQYLIQQIKTGSQKALETVIDRYGSYVKAIAINIIKPPMTDADVEEVVSDVFLKLYQMFSCLCGTIREILTGEA